MRKRRRQPVLWLAPHVYNLINPSSGALGNSAFGVKFTIDGAGMVAGDVAGNISAPWSDSTVETDAAFQDSVDELQGNHYLLKRIVGKINVALDPKATLTTPQRWLVGAGFFVARSDNDLSGAGTNTPIGWAAMGAAERLSNYNPLCADTAREPWLWRRTWMLDMNPAGMDAAAFPRSNAYFPGTFDGPHVDTKSKRRVEDDERLWLAVGASPLFQMTATEEAYVDIYFEGRALVSLIKKSTRGSF